jgi:hypothetical protein
MGEAYVGRANGWAVLHALNLSLERFLRSEVPLPADQVDVDVAAPDKDWSARLTRPTLSIFLHEVRRSSSRSVTGTVTRAASGTYTREQLAPFVRVRWCLSLWTPEASDELRVLGEVLSLVVTTGGIPPEHLEPPLDTLGHPVELTLAGEDLRASDALWSGLGVAPRLAVELVGVLPVAPPLSRTVPAPPGDVQLATSDQRAPQRRSAVRRLGGTIADPAARGRRIIGPRGAAVVEDLGRYLVPAQPGDRLVIDVDPPREIAAGEDG